jgi:hypothetical protein
MGGRKGLETMKPHPNKAPFIGVLTVLDTPSDVPPAGGRGHRILLTKDAATDALDSLIGMGVNISEDGTRHNAGAKVGIIDSAEIRGCEIIISGYLFCRDFPAVIHQISACSEYGMSYELADARVEDMRANIWKLTCVTFTGAAIVLKGKAAFHSTDFVLI